MTALEKIAAALEHAAPHVKGAALQREVEEARELARELVKADAPRMLGQPISAAELARISKDGP